MSLEEYKVRLRKEIEDREIELGREKPNWKQQKTNNPFRNWFYDKPKESEEEERHCAQLCKEIEDLKKRRKKMKTGKKVTNIGRHGRN